MLKKLRTPTSGSQDTISLASPINRNISRNPYIILIRIGLDGKNVNILTVINLLVACEVHTFKIPKPVLQTLQERFPKAESKSWSMEGEFFEVAFEHKDSIQEALITEDGVIINLKTKLDTHGLPTPVHDALIAQYPDWTIVDMQKVQVFENVIYEMDLRKARKQLEIRYYASGQNKTTPQDIGSHFQVERE